MRATRNVIAVGLVALLAAPAWAQTRPDLRLVDAVERRDARASELLVKQRLDVNAAQPDGATALHWAAPVSYTHLTLPTN